MLKLQVPGATQFTSFPLSYAAPSTVPDAPTALTALGGDGSAALSWTAPANTGGQPIDFYRITPASGPTIQTPTNATTFNVTGLTNFTPYAYTVSAHNSIGYSAESSSVNVTPGPSPATNVSALGGQSAATVTWTAPANTTNLDYYRVTPDIGGVAQPALAQNTTGTPTSLVVTGLTNATQYTFTVAAHYTPPSAFGPESAPSGTVTPGGKSVIQVITADRPAGDLYIAEACANGGTLDFNDTTQSCNVVLPTGVLNANATYYETSGAIQRVSILDTRDVDAGWNVNVQMGNFVGATTGEAFNGGCLGFAPTATELSNTPIYTQAVTAGAPVVSDCAAPGLTTSTVAMNAAANGGLGRADLDAALALSIPVSAAADTYSATLTFTVI